MNRYSPHHICISVTNTGSSVAFYERFGFQRLGFYQGESASFCHLILCGLVLELMQVGGAEQVSPSSLNLQEDIKIIGLRHLALRSADVRLSHAILSNEGFQPTPLVLRGVTGMAYFFVRDPDGNFIEIVEDAREEYLSAYDKLSDCSAGSDKSQEGAV